MAKQSAVRVVPDDDLEWLLQSREAALGRRAAQIEPSRGRSLESDKRRLRNPVVERASVLGSRFLALPVPCRSALAAVYGVSAEMLREQILSASNLEVWHRVERSFGRAAGLGLHLSPLCDDGPRVRRLDHVGGPWCTVRGRQFLALIVAGGEALEEAIELTKVELARAYVSWRGPVEEEPRERPRSQRWSTDYIAPVRISP